MNVYFQFLLPLLGNQFSNIIQTLLALEAFQSSLHVYVTGYVFYKLPFHGYILMSLLSPLMLRAKINSQYFKKTVVPWQHLVEVVFFRVLFQLKINSILLHRFRMNLDVLKVQGFSLQPQR